MKPILKWQYDQLIKELILLQGHDADPTCPCKTEGENCVRKHLLTIEALAQETEPMESDEDNREKLVELADQARMLRDIEESGLCGGDDAFPVQLSIWSREWRKRFEAYSLACELKGGNMVDLSKYDFPKQKTFDNKDYHLLHVFDSKDKSNISQTLADEAKYWETAIMTSPDGSKTGIYGHRIGNPHGSGNKEKYDSCIEQVEAKIQAGDLPEGSSPHAICTASGAGKVGNPHAPAGAKLEVVVLIDQDLWDEKVAEGVSDEQLQKAIEKSITLTDTVSGIVATPPVFDIDSVTLLKYY